MRVSIPAAHPPGVTVCHRERHRMSAARRAAMQNNEPVSAKSASDDTTRMLVGGMIVTLGAMGGIAVLADKPAWAVVAFFLSFPGIIFVAYLSKLLEMRA